MSTIEVPATATPGAPALEADAPVPTRAGALAALQARYPLLQLALLAAVFAYGAATLEGFASTPSVKSMLILASLVGLAAVGQTLVVLVGGFDLSVSGFIVAGALVVTQLTAKYHLSFEVGLLLAVAAAGTLGALVGFICHRYRIQPIIVTLAMGAIAVGLVQVQTGGAVVGAAPAWLSQLTSPIGTTFGTAIPPLIAIWIVVAVAMAAFLHRTVAGRRLYTTGANPRAAEYALVRTGRVWVLVFAFSAITASLVGVLLAGFAGNVDSTLGDPYLFQSLAAVIVGGTAFGGRGDYSRTVVGALLLTVLTTVLVGKGFGNADQQILYGAIILLAMAIYGRDRRLRDRV